MTQANTPLICIPYFSGSGHTARLAAHIGSGAGSARLIDVAAITDADWAALDAATLIVFGAPTYMGSTAAQFDVFLEEASSRWQDMVWADKMAAGFTVATHPSGDKLSALMRMSVYAAQMGMIWVGQTSIGAPVFPKAEGLNTDGSWLGLMATSSRDKSELITPQDALTANSFGTRLAGAAQRWSVGAD
ncbi:NAD(P)H dehydrogenase (quinone) [Pelagimonas varians]|uniref:NAD(P)H:quinone oxidoreductase n=2 Tax=Pelagimonas varians TaxID=696760 RepID=A0A238JZN4_9RHOB|nr:NAD(P)H-dependent oxidoreductase [Pelagimonas varians]PYG33244.1 NAD(P)H dehydrogenase (quinone) [Pelagimonas varians]SMX36108.1 NAD(P)H:quinone oxidoreductase [Pelagimonas varians]